MKQSSACCIFCLFITGVDVDEELYTTASMFVLLKMYNKACWGKKAEHERHLPVYGYH